jgi:hypothetical protein
MVHNTEQWNLDLSFLKGVEKTNDECAKTINHNNHFFNKKVVNCLGTMDAEINKFIFMELYSGAKMVDDKYFKMNNMRSRCHCIWFSHIFYLEQYYKIMACLEYRSLHNSGYIFTQCVMKEGSILVCVKSSLILSLVNVKVFIQGLEGIFM